MYISFYVNIYFSKHYICYPNSVPSSECTLSLDNPSYFDLSMVEVGRFVGSFMYRYHIPIEDLFTSTIYMSV